MSRKILICGGTGFIGRNLVEYFNTLDEYEVYATGFKLRLQSVLLYLWKIYLFVLAD